MNLLCQTKRRLLLVLTKSLLMSILLVFKSLNFENSDLSSANTLIIDFKQSSKSFIQIKNNRGQEAVVQRCSIKKVFLEISQNSQENTCARVSFSIKLQARGMQLY